MSAAGGPGTLRLRLYVAHSTHNSAQALMNLRAICRTHFCDRHRIEVIDVLKDPARALADGIFMTPTLVKLAPLPVARIVGTLSQLEPVLHALGLEPTAA